MDRKIGFDCQKYIREQSAFIISKAANYQDKLYLNSAEAHAR